MSSVQADVLDRRLDEARERLALCGPADSHEYDRLEAAEWEVEEQLSAAVGKLFRLSAQITELEREIAALSGPVWGDESEQSEMS